MKINMELIKELREKTGLGIMACKKALEKEDGNVEKAIDFLRKEGLLKAAKKSGRSAKEGVIHSYIHYNKKLGVLVEVNCETDFVANNAEFEEFVHGLAVHIGAVEPAYLSKDEITEEIIEREREVYIQQMKESGKPDNLIEKIVENKIKKFFEENCMLNQEYFGSDNGITVEDFIKENIAKFGENILLRRFVLYKIGA